MRCSRPWLAISGAKANADAFLLVADQLLAGDSADIAKEFNMCRCRKTKKCDKVLIEIRLHSFSRLRNFAPIIDEAILAAGGTRLLGRKPGGDLVRKAGGK